MPYERWDEVNEAIRGIEPRVSLAQANLIAEWADGMDAEKLEDVWATAIAQFKRLYEVKDGAWVKKEADAEAAEFLFAELSERRPVEVLRVGEFVERHGQDVSISEEDLDAFVANFAAGTAGQDVPVDVDHRRGEAAGWVTKVWREGSRLLASIDWNEVGKRLVGERVYRYLSASIDTKGRVIKSISLVNFPAVKGLKPVELSEGVYAWAEAGLVEQIVAAIREVLQGGDYHGSEKYTMGRKSVDLGERRKGDEGMTEEELKRLREEIKAEMEAELVEHEKTLAELREQVRTEVEAELAEEAKRRAELAGFAAEVCGEKDGAEAGLSAKPDEVVEFLAALPEKQVEAAKAMLKSKVVEFGERGSSRDGRGGKKELEEPYASQLRDWIAAEYDLAEWFKLNADVIGQAEEYDLSEFESKE